MILSNRAFITLAATVALTAFTQPAAAQTPSAADVGDADSFGHTVIYLGFRPSTQINLQQSCEGFDPALGRCVPIVPGGTTTINESDLGVIRLPARATRTLICHAVTVFYVRDHSNPAPTSAQAEFSENALFTIESPVLNDPTLINAFTGQPFNGRLNIIGATNIAENHPLAPGGLEHEQASNTKLCGAGLVSRQDLIEFYGLSPSLATRFFERPITIRMGLSARARQITGLRFFYLLRLFGDR